MAASFNQFYGKIRDGFCLKTLPRRGFILKPIARPFVPLNNGTRDFERFQ